MFSTAIKDFLDQHNARYVTIPHPPAFTAQQTAATAHIPGRLVAKTVMVKLDGELAMAVIPAHRMLDLAQLARVANVRTARLAGEEEFAGLFPNCEVGAMPPLGALYGLDVYLDRTLCRDEQIVINAGSHTELLRLPFCDFRRLARPRVADLCIRR